MTPILKRTPLYQAHVALQARFTEFAGWEMPLQYRGILEECRAVRRKAGVFDVSHMGRLEIKGRDARSLLDKTLTASVAVLPLGKARYSAICREDGGILDDVVVYSLEPELLLIVCNAASRIKVQQWLSAWAVECNYKQVTIEDLTEATAMIAWQGPHVAKAIDSLYPSTASRLGVFGCVELDLAFGKLLISRTGYTGEDGFEFILSAEHAPSLWDAVLSRGTTACGLGARDTLRLEAALLLYGNDMDLSVNPLEAGLQRFVALDKPDFVGKEALVKAKASGLARRLVGFIMIDRGIPRHGCPIVLDGVPVGWVTSGGYSPTLDKGIGMGYVPDNKAGSGTPLEIDVRGRLLQAQVVALPFYKRDSKRGNSSQAEII